MLSNCFLQSQLADEIEKLRSELDQFRLRAGSLTEPTLSRYVGSTSVSVCGFTHKLLRVVWSKLKKGNVSHRVW